MTARISPSWCDLQTAITAGITHARHHRQDALVTWGAVTFRVRPSDDGQAAWAAYLAAARPLIRLEDAARGRSFTATDSRHNPETGEVLT